MPRQGETTTTTARRTIEAGDSGIWVTCNKGRERQCIGELRDLFSEHAAASSLVRGDTAALASPAPGRAVTDASDAASAEGQGIEGAIQAEIAEMRLPRGSRELFTPVRVDVPCGG